MIRTIELKHVGPKNHVRSLIEELIDRLEEKLQHLPQETVSIHVLFDENGTHKLYRAALTCHIPGHMTATHKEGREAGDTIRDAFKDLERQLDHSTVIIRREYLRKRLTKSLRKESPV